MKYLLSSFLPYAHHNENNLGKNLLKEISNWQRKQDKHMKPMSAQLKYNAKPECHRNSEALNTKWATVVRKSGRHSEQQQQSEG